VAWNLVLANQYPAKKATAPRTRSFVLSFIAGKAYQKMPENRAKLTNKMKNEKSARFGEEKKRDGEKPSRF
jgi:hypothetical protein